MPTGTNPDEIKGWMTLADVSKAYNVPVAEMLAAFELPADTPETTAIKDLESETFSTAEPAHVDEDPPRPVDNSCRGSVRPPATVTCGLAVSRAIAVQAGGAAPQLRRPAS